MYSINVRLRSLIILLLIPWSFAGPPAPLPPQPSEVFQPILPIRPPHCTKMIIATSTLSHAPGEEIVRAVVMNVHIGLQNTICFRIGNGSYSFGDDFIERNEGDGWLHTLTLTQLEQHHPISQQYTFAIPEVRTSCICDCNPAAEVCSAGTHSFQLCNNTHSPKNGICYRTFHPSQSDAGCPPGSQSKLCCEVTFTPYKNISYTAVKLEQPSTFAVFKYVAYDYTAGLWNEKDKSTIRVNIDGRTQSRFLDSRNRIELGVSAMGKASRQLETGMYFARSNPGGEMDELRKQPLNEINENNFERLGWYRKDADGRFAVQSGKVKMQKIHLAKVENCKEQKSQSYLDAHHYVDKNSGNDERFALGDTVERTYPWIQSAQIRDGSSRQAVVIHSEGTNLEIMLRMKDSDRGLSFYHDFSKLGDFTGTIIVDFKSNRYFNVTAYNATGILYGRVKKNIDKNSMDDFSFTTYIDDLRSTNKTVIVPMPEMIGGGDRLICIRADDGMPESEICRIIPFREDPLEINLLENTWRELEGHCPDCNKISISGFLSNLNPANWASGAASLSNFIMVTADVFFYIIIAIIAYFVITRCIYPLARCMICPAESVICCYQKAQKRHHHHHKCSHQDIYTRS